MKRFLAFVRKEFYHILRDHRTLLILVGMPVVQILLFGYAITNEISNAPIAILDHSNDEITALIKKKILTSDYFVLSSNLSAENEIEDIFKDGITKMAVVFEPNFSETLEKTNNAQIQFIADASDPNTANTLVNYAQAIVADFMSRRVNGGMPYMIEIRSRMVYNPELKGVYYFVPGTIVILLMLVSAMMTSISIAREKEIGTMEVLLASPMNPSGIILAKVIPYLLLSFVVSGIILTLGKFVFGVPIIGSLPLLLGVTILFIILALTLGILISTVVDTQQAALLISLMGLMLPTILLSGFIFPVENMPRILQVLANLVPARWFIIVLKAIMLKGASIGIIWKEIVILCLFIMVFTGASIKKFKVRLE